MRRWSHEVRERAVRLVGECRVGGFGKEARRWVAVARTVASIVFATAGAVSSDIVPQQNLGGHKENNVSDFFTLSTIITPTVVAIQ